MTAILFIKTSSLGDVIHHMPALADARRRMPETRFCWVVEEAYAPLARLHPAVDQVIPVATRRWRRLPVWPSTWREFSHFKRAVAGREYEAIIDTQGLLRSALIGRLAKGPRHGYGARSIREPFASRLYDIRHTVSRDLHAIQRNRMLTGLALGYEPEGAIDFGLSRQQLAGVADAPYALLLHATARAEKQWPEESWIALGRSLRGKGVSLILPWGSARERARSERIAAAIPGARAPEWRPLDGMARLVAGASFVVGVDTGLLHLAAALGVPLAGIFIASEPGLTGPMGKGPIVIVGGKGRIPAVAEVEGAVEQIL